MPLRVEKNLPAISSLKEKGIYLLGKNEEFPDCSLPRLRVGILNLMPLKEATENDLLSVLDTEIFNIDIDFIETDTYRGSHTNHEHLDNFYIKWKDAKKVRYDGFIITGAPVEGIPFQDVTYWSELEEIMDYCRCNIKSTLYVCWGAQAGLYHFYGIGKKMMNSKLSGVYLHSILERVPLMTGLKDGFIVPHSRYTTVSKSDILKEPNLSIVSESKIAGVHCVMTDDGREIFVTGHSEYSLDTLEREYIRDIKKGLNPSVPENYYLNDNPELGIKADWSDDAKKIYTNWLKYYVS